MKKIITFCLIIVGLINFIPLYGIISTEKLESAYAINLVSNDLIILMRHRALMFGILGGFILYAAFISTYQTVSMIMAFVSMMGFAFLVFLQESHNAAIDKVFMFDIIGLVFLLIAAILKLILYKKTQ